MSLHRSSKKGKAPSTVSSSSPAEGRTFSEVQAEIQALQARREALRAEDEASRAESEARRARRHRHRGVEPAPAATSSNSITPSEIASQMPPLPESRPETEVSRRSARSSHRSNRSLSVLERAR